MRKAIIVLGVTIAMLIGIGVANGQTPTPTPELTPTSTPTPVEKACEQFDLAVWEAWWGTIARTSDDAAHAKYHKDLTDRLIARLSWTMALKKTEPAMERMVSPLYWTLKTKYGNLSYVLRSGFDHMVIGARQMERVCFARGYEKQFDVLPDVLAEYTCVNHHFVNRPLSPSLEGIVWSCQIRHADVNHNHDYQYADKYHAHGGY